MESGLFRKNDPCCEQGMEGAHRLARQSIRDNITSSSASKSALVLEVVELFSP